MPLFENCFILIQRENFNLLYKFEGFDLLMSPPSSVMLGLKNKELDAYFVLECIDLKK